MKNKNRDDKEAKAKRQELYRKIGDNRKLIQRDEEKRRRAVEEHEVESNKKKAIKKKAAFKFVEGDRVMMQSNIPKRLDPIKLKGRVVGAYCDPRYLDAFYAIRVKGFPNKRYGYSVIICPEDTLKKRK